MSHYSSPTSQLEVSNQILDTDSNQEEILSVYNSDLPLFSFEQEALVSNNAYPDNLSTTAEFPFSSDAFSLPYFETTQSRRHTADYKQSRSKVAILIGESSLAANISLIPEKTIIVLDNSPSMIKFMQKYVESLRKANDAEEWRKSLISIGPRHTNREAERQYKMWQQVGEHHPLYNDDAFFEAQHHARQKAIVPTIANVLDSSDIQTLANELTHRQAQVTFMNLSNLLPYLSERGENISRTMRNLEELPITPNAPILANSLGVPLNAQAGRHSVENYQTGPFFGLDNLIRATAQHTGSTMGAVGLRHYNRQVNHPDPISELRNIANQILTR